MSTKDAVLCYIRSMDKTAKRTQPDNSSILITGNSAEELSNLLKSILKTCDIESKVHPDLLELSDEKSIGIDQIRGAKKFLAQKPNQARYTVLVVHEAHKLTPDAQNALLKALEEPEKTSKIILISNQEDKLLTTIRSRCKKLFVGTETKLPKNKEGIAEVFVRSDIGQRLALIEENRSVFTNKEETLVFLDELLAQLRANMRPETTKKIRRVMEIKKNLADTNVSPRLSVETLAFVE